jgi:NADH-quinone oxidoreductase subunit N
MNGSQLVALSPLIILGATPVLMMLVTAFHRRHGLIMGIGLVGLGAAATAVFSLSGQTTPAATPLLMVDPWAATFIVLTTAATAFVCLLSYPYLEQFDDNREEYYILMLLATFGAAVLASGTNFASLFLGFEILSVSLYALIAYPHRIFRQIEAGIKYLILAAASSAFMLFGMALLYAAIGSLEFSRLAQVMGHMPAGAGGQSILLTTGTAMIIVGLGFKLALVPFHWWTPDVYQGAPAPVTAFVATVSKAGILAVLIRLFAPLDMVPGGSLFLILALMAAASMLIGNLLALMQNNVKRILAYSSIAHLGYVLVAFLAGGKMAQSAVIFYLTAYFITILGAFGVVTVLSGPSRETEDLAAYRGLFQTRPVLASVFVFMLFSLAGIPLTAGFIGKIYLLAAGIHGARWALVMILIVGSTIGLFYYLRIIAAMFVSSPEKETKTAETTFPLAGKIALTVLTGFVIWLGIVPSALISLLQKAFG